MIAIIIEDDSSGHIRQELEIVAAICRDCPHPEILFRNWPFIVDRICFHDDMVSLSCSDSQNHAQVLSLV